MDSGHKIKVILVDDSIVIRRLLRKILVVDPEIEVTGEAPNGRSALAQMAISPPDVVILDVDMPILGGLATLTELRKRWPKLPVIMFSSLTQRGAFITIEALDRGANDFVSKPSNIEGLEQSTDEVAAQLREKIKFFAAKFPRGGQEEGTDAPLASASKGVSPSKEEYATSYQPMRKDTKNVEIVTIGASTGGPNALLEVLKRVPRDFPVPIVICQHMPPVFTKILAERLTDHCSIPVVEVLDKLTLEPGKGYLAAGGVHMEVTSKGYVATNRKAPENSSRPSVDVLFRSVARNYGANVLAVVLTGMGQDGFLGAQMISQGGGKVIAQNKDSALVWGMPAKIVEAGLADGVFNLDQIGNELVKIAKHKGGNT